MLSYGVAIGKPHKACSLRRWKESFGFEILFRTQPKFCPIGPDPLDPFQVSIGQNLEWACKSEGADVHARIPELGDEGARRRIVRIHDYEEEEKTEEGCWKDPRNLRAEEYQKGSEFPS